MKSLVVLHLLIDEDSKRRMSWKSQGNHPGGVYTSQGSHNCCHGFCSKRNWSSISIFILSGVKKTNFWLYLLLHVSHVICLPAIKGVKKYTIAKIRDFRLFIRRIIIRLAIYSFVKKNYLKCVLFPLKLKIHI